MSITNPFSQTGSAPQTSAEMKSAIMTQVQQETAMSNARALINKVNENCFEKCIPSPGSSLSSKEQSCLTSCMEKYIQMWNATSRAYIARIGQEQKAAGLGGSGGGVF
ncbi:mitochondrial intermembrane space translocase subunit Tim [Paracoccidioides lutzii Pb01]|uniref:Mitochondrial import inner membrane translocase subunit n=1 Tax=Paracoccidioides lutzii (strain ATCC MYA-826 / Pb01) TaxID=502779 RepID=C1GNL4_PARBA|nr:mitochondrial intermembrane space translocase subunit Tim [Paracoccidioides lutzii Pb01]EEH35786.1 mitochondrial intermembrane space translocase subunit Tim [Paracoccidioides lutzii Pb01]